MTERQKEIDGKMASASQEQNLENVEIVIKVENVEIIIKVEKVDMSLDDPNIIDVTNLGPTPLAEICDQNIQPTSDKNSSSTAVVVNGKVRRNKKKRHRGGKKRLCIICYKPKQVQKLRPCGHRMCTTCARQLTNPICPTCGGVIKSYLPPELNGCFA